MVPKTRRLVLAAVLASLLAPRHSHAQRATGRTNGSVEVVVTIDATGAVRAIELPAGSNAEIARELVDDALARVRAMRFTPAVRDGVPVLRFVHRVAIEPRAFRRASQTDAALPSPVLLVRATEPPRSATQYTLPIQGLGRIARVSGPDLLTLVPGVQLANESTEGDAHEVSLRGFAGDNGQDIAFSLDRVPLNDESNPRTQGYADLYFIIPELVDRLTVTEGNADPRAGNFALAGAVDFHLALHDRGAQVRASYGTYGFARLTGLLGPAGTGSDTFVGIDLVHSDGFGAMRRFDRASGLAQWSTDLGHGVQLRLFGALYATRWDAPGPLRDDDYRAGRVDFFGTAPNVPFQGGVSMRGLFAATLEMRRAYERSTLQAFAGLRNLTQRENATGYLEHPDEGDLSLRRYGAITLGARGDYHRTFMVGRLAQEGEIGWVLRHDRVHGQIDALDARTAAPLAMHGDEDSATDAAITQVGAYLEARVRPFRRLTLRGAARFDLFAYDIDGTTYDDTGATARSPRTALATRLGPKASIDVDLGRGFAAVVSFGTGYRTPSALAIGANERVELVRSTSEEAGIQWSPSSSLLGGARVSASLALFHVLVDNDAIFDPLSGDEVPIGSTHRYGGTFWFRTRPLDWLDVNASVAYTRSSVESDALDGILPAGSSIPYLPSLVARLDAAAERQVARWRAWPVRIRGGLGASVRGPRDLVQSGTSPAVLLLDASTGVRVGPIGFDVSGRNLLDVRWAETEFEYASNFDPGASPSPTPIRHFTAGAPFTMFATVSLSL